MQSIIDLCFMCSNEKSSTVDKRILTEIEYLMPEITIIKLKIPLRICSVCEKKLNLFSTFKKECVKNSLRFLETWMKEEQNNTDVTEKYKTCETNVNQINELCISEEVLAKSENLDVKLVGEICIKEDPLPENHLDRECDDLLQKIMKEESPPQTIDTHLYENSSADMEDESDQNSDDPDYAFVDDSEINSDENISVGSSVGRKIYSKKVFQCNECKKRFSKKSNLAIHMKIHTGVKDFQCNECKKWFSQKSSLTVHMKSHTGVKKFQCNECKKWFLHKSSLVQHNKLHTGVKDFQCNECKKWFSQKSSLFKHNKLHTGVKDFQCNECKKWFSQKSSLVKHNKLHTGVKDFQCKECKKWFLHKSNLTVHMKSHTGVKDFQCNECKKWFLHKSSLVQHNKLHTGVKDFQCNECKKWFSLKSTLAKHVKIHTKVKDF